MSQHTVIQLFDDLDGSPIPDGGGTTISFALDGTSYEIDLTTEHAEALRAALAAYIEAGRRPQPRRPAPAEARHAADQRPTPPWFATGHAHRGCQSQTVGGFRHPSSRPTTRHTDDDALTPRPAHHTNATHSA